MMQISDHKEKKHVKSGTPLAKRDVPEDLYYSKDKIDKHLLNNTYDNLCMYQCCKCEQGELKLQVFAGVVTSSQY